MTKKVNGYTINHGGWIEFDQAPDDNGPWVPCTMVIADKAHERVFTESEVKAILKPMKDLVKHGGSAIIMLDSDAATKEWRNAMDRARRALTNHGIVLDPA